MRDTHHAQEEPARRRAAASLLGAYLRDIPEHVPGEPAGLAAHFAVGAAGEFLEELEAIYHVRRWDRESFKRAFVDGALEGWKESIVGETERSIHVVGDVCPLNDLAQKDPRACHACRAFQEAVARRALGDEIQSVEFPHLITKGDGACHSVIRFKPREKKETP